LIELYPAQEAFAMAVDPGIKILLAEDAGTMRKMEIRILNQLGYKNIVEAGDGNDAVEKLQASPDFDLVISDWAMPGNDGHELLTWIRGQEKFKKLPFLMATGHGDKQYTETALESGADGVVAKPFTPDELRVLIDKAFGIEETPDLDEFVVPRFADTAVAAGLTTVAAPDDAAGAGTAALEVSETRRSREGKYLIFNLGDERYGVGILDVREIIGMMPITKMPRMPGALKGVINLRGRVIPVLDMRVKFGMEAREYTPRTCIVISEVSGLSGSTLVGGIVDSVSEVFQIKEADIEDSPNFGGDFSGEFILGMAKTEKGVIILLEIDRIMHASEVVQLAGAV